MELRELNSIAAGGSEAQGVVFDGTNYFYTDGTTLYKYNSSGTLVTSRNVSTDGTAHHIGDLCVGHDGKLRIATNNYPTTPKVGYIRSYDPSNLNYISEVAVTADHATGIDYSGGSYWVIYNFVVEERDTSFNLLNSYSPDTQITGTGEGWQGGVWVDSKLYLNVHENNYPDVVQVLDSSLNFVEQVNRPAYCSQGLAYYGGNFYLALRNSGANKIVTALLLPDDHRTERIATTSYSGTNSTTSTSYVEQGNAQVSIFARKGDMIKVEMDAVFKVSTSSLRAYVDVAQNSAATQATDITTEPSIRCASTASDLDSKSFTRIFRADEEGIFTFSMYWKMLTSGTATANNRSMTAQVVGTYSETYV